MTDTNAQGSTIPSTLEPLQLLRILIAALSRSARAVESQTGATNAQLFLLRQVAATPGLSVGEIALRIGARQNTVSAVLRRLIAARWIRRTPAPLDARRAELRLEPAGEALLRQAPAAPTEALLLALAALPEVERSCLTIGLHALVQELGLSIEEPPLLFESP